MAEIILKTPIEELIPKVIEFNNEELLMQADLFLQKYKGKKFDDSTIADAKHSRAEINNIVKHINSVRVSIKREYDKPYMAFKGKLDEVILKLETVSTQIDEVIKESEERQKENKQFEVEEIYKQVFSGLEELVPLSMIYNPKWNNKGYSLAIITKEMQDTYARICDDLSIIEKTNIHHSCEIKALYFKSLNLKVALSEFERYEKSKEYFKQQQRKSEQVFDLEEKQETPIQGEETKETVYDISFKVTATKEQLKALRVFFDETKIKYEKI